MNKKLVIIMNLIIVIIITTLILLLSFFLISCSKYFCELESFSRNSGQQVICDFIGWTISTNTNFHRLISFTRELRRSYGDWHPIKYCNNFTDLFAVERKKITPSMQSPEDFLFWLQRI